MKRIGLALAVLLPLSFSSSGCWFFEHCSGGIGIGQGGTTGNLECGAGGPIASSSPNTQAVARMAMTAATSVSHTRDLQPLKAPSLANAVPQPIVLYRITDILIRDPHTFEDLGAGICVDRTGIVNSAIHTRFHADTDADGFIDAGAVMAFQGTLGVGPGGRFQIISAACDTLNPQHCLPDIISAEIDALYSYSVDNANPCLSPAPGHLRPYVPALALPGQPCFATSPFELQATFGGSTFTLNSTMLAGSFAGANADSIVNGVMRAFISEAAAATILLPSGAPDISGQLVSATLPGGAGACVLWDDRDLGPDGVTNGWWIYANFSARRVEFPSDVLDIAPAGQQPGPTLAALPNPFRPSVRILFTLPVAQAARLVVLDPAGRRIKTLADGVRGPGGHAVVWDGSTEDGSRSPTGVYYAVLSTTEGRSVTRLVRLN